MKGPEWYEIILFFALWLPVIWAIQGRKDAELHKYVQRRVAQIFEKESHHLPN